MKRTEDEEKLKYLLQEAIDKLKKEEIEEDEFPSIDCEYYFVNDGGFIDNITYDDDIIDWYRKNFIGIYETIEECYRALEIKKAFKKASLNFKPDWEDNEYKWYVYFDHKVNLIKYGFCMSYQQGIDYFASREVLEKLVAFFGEEDVKKYYLMIDTSNKTD